MRRMSFQKYKQYHKLINILKMFDREYKKEKMLEIQKKANEASKKVAKEHGNAASLEAKK